MRCDLPSSVSVAINVSDIYGIFNGLGARERTSKTRAHVIYIRDLVVVVVLFICIYSHQITVGMRSDSPSSLAVSTPVSLGR